MHFGIELQILPAQYRLLRIQAPGGCFLWSKWRLSNSPETGLTKLSVTRRVGDRWLDDGETVMLEI